MENNNYSISQNRKYVLSVISYKRIKLVALYIQKGTWHMIKRNRVLYTFGGISQTLWEPVTRDVSEGIYTMTCLLINR